MCSSCKVLYLGFYLFVFLTIRRAFDKINIAFADNQQLERLSNCIQTLYHQTRGTWMQGCLIGCCIHDFVALLHAPKFRRNRARSKYEHNRWASIHLFHTHGTYMWFVVERVPLAEEPPLDEQCEDQFLVKITAPLIPARKDLRVSAFDVVRILQSFLPC